MTQAAVIYRQVSSSRQDSGASALADSAIQATIW